MKTSLYTVTIPVFIKNIERISGILDKAVAHLAEQEEGDEAALLATRLAPDQFPLVKQVQLLSDTAKGFAPRFTDTAPVPMEDTEATIAELKQRLEATLTLLREVKPEDIDGKEDTVIRIKWFPGKHLTGFDYAFDYALPNFFFHMTTAYSIMRHAGVTLGKADFLAGLALQDDTEEAVV
jgi:hypothetical protein